MIEITNDCCDCATESYPCIGDECELKNVKHYICDNCKEEVGRGFLYHFDGMELCRDCIMDLLEIVD